MNILNMVLGYHEFTPTPSRDVYAVTPSIFAAQLELVREAAARLEPGMPVITFDDAHASQIEYAPAPLAAAGLRALFFVPTAHVGCRVSSATWPQLRRLQAQGHLLGSHTHTHALLTHCTPVELWNQLVRSRDVLEDRLGTAVDSISLPGGRGSRSVLLACAAAGYSHVYTSEPGNVSCIESRYGQAATVHGRLIVRRTTPPHVMAAYLNAEPATLRGLKAKYRLRQGLRRITGDRLYGSLWRAWLREPALHAARTGES